MKRPVRWLLGLVLLTWVGGVVVGVRVASQKLVVNRVDDCLMVGVKGYRQIESYCCCATRWSGCATTETPHCSRSGMSW